MPGILDLFLHLDKHLDTLVQSVGATSYIVLFLIIFCETGLVVTPFLPGDSLLFAAGALAGLGSLNIFYLLACLMIASILGDSVNYFIGRKLGDKVFKNRNSKIFRADYLEKTQTYFAKYGPKTIIIARFAPIVRTFSPFLAGVGKMPYSTFLSFSVSGSFLWITSMTMAGYLFGGIDIVKRNFSAVVILIVLISILPAVIEFLKARSGAKSSI